MRAFLEQFTNSNTESETIEQKSLMRFKIRKLCKLLWVIVVCTDKTLDPLDMEDSGMCYHIPWAGTWTVTVPPKILTVPSYLPGELHRYQALCDSGRAGQSYYILFCLLQIVPPCSKWLCSYESGHSTRKSKFWLTGFKQLDYSVIWFGFR